MRNCRVGVWMLVLPFASAGCFVEGVVGVTPRMNQEFTDFSGATTSNTHAAWTVGVVAGFYLDILRGSVGYVPTTSSTSTSGPAGMKSSGHQVRVDIDVPSVPIARVTASYTTVRNATVDATNAMTPTSSPQLPNGKLTTRSQSGGMLFAGLTLARRTYDPEGIQHHVASAMASFGLSYISTHTDGRETYGNTLSDSTPGTIPGVSNSGLGVQVRFTLALLQNITQRSFLSRALNPTPEDLEAINAAAAMQREAEEKAAAEQGTSTPITPDTPVDNPKCGNMKGDLDCY